MKLKINTEFLEERYKHSVLPSYLLDGNYEIEDSLADDYLDTLSKSSGYPIVIKKINGEYTILPNGSSRSGMYFVNVAKKLETINVSICTKQYKSGKGFGTTYRDEYHMEVEYKFSKKKYKFIDVDLDSLIFNKLLMNLYDNNISKFTCQVNLNVLLDNVKDSGFLRYDLSTIVSGNISVMDKNSKGKDQIEELKSINPSLTEVLSSVDMNEQVSKIKDIAKKYHYLTEIKVDPSEFQGRQWAMSESSKGLTVAKLVIENDLFNKNLTKVYIEYSGIRSSIDFNLDMKDKNHLAIYEDLIEFIEDLVHETPSDTPSNQKPKNEKDESIRYDSLIKLIMEGSDFQCPVNSEGTYYFNSLGVKRLIELKNNGLVLKYKGNKGLYIIQDYYEFNSRNEEEEIESLLNNRAYNKSLPEMINREENIMSSSLLNEILDELRNGSDKMMDVNGALISVEFKYNDGVVKITMNTETMEVWYSYTSSDDDSATASYTSIDSSMKDEFEEFLGYLNEELHDDDEESVDTYKDVINSLRNKLHAPDYEVLDFSNSSKLTRITIKLNNGDVYMCSLDESNEKNIVIRFKLLRVNKYNTPSVKIEYEDSKDARDTWFGVFKEFYNKNK